MNNDLNETQVANMLCIVSMVSVIVIFLSTLGVNADL